MHLAENGEMEVTKRSKIPICEVHFYGYADNSANSATLPQRLYLCKNRTTIRLSDN